MRWVLIVLQLMIAGIVLGTITVLFGKAAAWAAATAILWVALLRARWALRRHQAAAHGQMEIHRGSYESIISMLCGALELRDNVSSVHSQRVSRLASVIAWEMGLRQRDVQAIQKAAILHDVGRAGLAQGVLTKSGPLSEKEWKEMKRHPQIGADILAQISDLEDAAEVVRAHHERFDGTGYPDGLKEERIPVGSRIFSVADAYVAMTSDRPYRKAMPHAKAVQEIVRNSGGQFDPDMVVAFVKAEKRALVEKGNEERNPEGAPRPAAAVKG